MGEKRFTVESTMVRECILDNQTGEQLDTFDYTERLCDLLNEQQDTISQLQDLCGKSDYENAKLRIENNQLRQILKDIVASTDETYMKNKSIYKVTVIFDNKEYLKIKECLNE